MRNFLARLMTEEEGATMVEYALMVALIAAAAVAAIGTLSGAINTKFTGVGTSITSAGN
ncbi:Flp family type IVb pilin [Paludisphaera sp.]|uniref:Flp family type IVb pilin n=1 Tax=Paludisphaera sp. TaxID=2017432 RepID=UPI00301C8E82